MIFEVFFRLFVVAVGRSSRDILVSEAGFIGVRSGEGDASWRKKESTQRRSAQATEGSRDDLLKQRRDRETICSSNGGIERRSVQTVNRSRRLSTVKDG